MAKTIGNVIKTVITGVSLYDTASTDGSNNTGAVTVGGAATVTATMGTTATLNQYAGFLVTVLSGTGAGQIRLVSSNTAAQPTVITVGTNWTTQPTNGAVIQLEPIADASYTDLGFLGEAALNLKAVPLTFPIADGGLIQKGYDCTVETDWLEVLSLNSTFDTAWRNKCVWIKAKTTTGLLALIKNINLDIEVDMDLSAKGVSRVKLSGKKVVANLYELLSIG